VLRLVLVFLACGGSGAVVGMSLCVCLVCICYIRQPQHLTALNTAPQGEHANSMPVPLAELSTHRVSKQAVCVCSLRSAYSQGKQATLGIKHSQASSCFGPIELRKRARLLRDCHKRGKLTRNVRQSTGSSLSGVLARDSRIKSGLLYFVGAPSSAEVPPSLPSFF